MILKSALFLGIASVLLACSSPARAQTGGLSGIVSDAAGAPVTNAKVILVSAKTKQGVETQTDAGGKYVFAMLAGGAYQLSVAAEGFMPIMLDVMIAEGAAQSADEKLQPSQH